MYRGFFGIINYMISWWNVIGHRRVLVGFLVVLLWVVLGLVVQSVSVAACGAFLAGGFGLLLARGDLASGVRSVICISSAVFAGTGKMKTVEDIRNHINDAIQDMRYGYDTLPEKNLSKAAELLQGDDDVLVITTEQRKNIYLKGFVGARYADGKWNTLADAQYKGKRAGMLTWLS